jgi:glycosyltransferase involved in cell wall biosynthesis
MRIYLYLRRFPRLGTPIASGMNKAVHGLATGLVHAGATVTILCEDRQPSHIETESGYDIRCFYNRTKPSSFTVSSALKDFIDTEMEPGLVVLNGIFMPSVALIARRLHRRGIQYVMAPHDPYHPEIFRKRAHAKWPYWFLLERPALRRAVAVQVLDERHRNYLRHLNVATRVIPLPNGFTPAEAAHEPTPLDNGDPRFMFLGRIDSHNKGLDLLIKAFMPLAESTTARLTLAGPPWGDRAMLERMSASLIRKNRVEFLDPDFTRTSSQVISDYHVFCLPSRFEGFGLAALEAMLAARPVLVSEVGGIAPHVIAAGCGVVVKSDVESIRAGMLNLLSRRNEWTEMGRRGREYVLKNLTWDRIGQEALKAYKRATVEKNSIELLSIPMHMRTTERPAQMVLQDA